MVLPTMTMVLPSTEVPFTLRSLGPMTPWYWSRARTSRSSFAVREVSAGWSAGVDLALGRTIRKGDRAEVSGGC
jgi:hypothetical protein